MGNNGRFSDGLLFGAILGGAAVFLLGTEKGNKVLKIMLEEGKAGFSDLMDEIDDHKKQAKEMVEVMEDDVDQEIFEGDSKSAQDQKDGEMNQESKSDPHKRFFKKGK